MSLPLPEALLDSLENTAGFNRKAFRELHLHNETRTSIRYNPEKLGLYKDDLPKDKIPWNPYGYYLTER
ncbi:MAG: methyltransferase RsmF C-terminal domain-like protein, partial [Arachidicoccus sp.]